MVNVIQARDFTLYTPIGSADTDITFRGFVDIYGNVIDTMPSDILYITLEPQSEDNQEIISCTGLTVVSGDIVTANECTRGLDAQPGVSGTAKSHAGNVTAILSDNPQVWDSKTSADEAETITEPWEFTNGLKATDAPVDNDDVPNKEYVDNLAIAGAATATPSVLGIAKLSQIAVDPVNPVVVSDNDWRVANGVASATGTDAYAITLPTAPVAYAIGQKFSFKADVPNTDACSLNVNGLGAVALKLYNIDPQNNFIKASSIVEVEHDGTNFQILSNSAKPMVSQTGEEIYGASTTGNDTYVITLSPAPVAYGFMRVTLNADVVNTGACTINVNGLGAKSIKLRNGSDPASGDVVVGLNDLEYDGTNFVLMSNAQPNGGKGVFAASSATISTQGVLNTGTITIAGAGKSGKIARIYGFLYTYYFTGGAPNYHTARRYFSGFFSLGTSGITWNNEYSENMSGDDNTAPNVSAGTPITLQFTSNQALSVSEITTGTYNSGVAKITAVYVSGDDLKIDYSITGAVGGSSGGAGLYLGPITVL